MQMQKSNPIANMRPSLKLTSLIMVIGAYFLIFWSDAVVSSEQRWRVLTFILSFYLCAGMILLLDSWNIQIGRWFTIAIFTIILIMGVGWLKEPNMLIFSPVPVLIAAMLLNLSAATFTAVGVSVWLIMLAIFPTENISSTTLTASLISVWMVFSLLFITYHAIYQTMNWLWDYFQRTRSLLDEARNRNVELSQALNDLAQANRELALLNKKIAAMRRIAEEARESKAAFAAKISHEFRTPLNMIIGLIDTLTKTPEVYEEVIPPLLLRDLEVVYRNSTHLAGMINDVLDLSRAEAGGFNLKREWADLADDISNALLAVQPLLTAKGLELRLAIEDNLPKIYYDRTRIRQVILNLVSNAARYTEKGTITVGANVEGSYIIVRVKDTGPGIPPEDTKRIFEPFYQSLHRFPQTRDGSGLGLSVSREIVKLHDGEMWVETEPGLGSTFFFKLRTSLPPELVSEAKGWVREDWMWQERTAWPKVPPLPNKMRVVLCDETGALPQVFKHLADEVEFITTTTLANTIETVQSVPAHFILFNGSLVYELSTSLAQARLHLPDTPIIGCSVSSYKQRGFEAGAVDHLLKPVTQADFEQLLESLDQPINRVLIVDDDSEIRHLYSRLLHLCDPTLELFTAADGAEALAQMHHTGPDLVLLDIVMPNIDGWQMLELKNQDETIAHIPVVIISAEDLFMQVSTSDVLFATIGTGITAQELFDISKQIATVLIPPEKKPDRAPQ